MPNQHDEPEFETEWDGDDPEGPQDCDLQPDEGDDTPTVPCPSCHEDIPDSADRCPYCGDWVVQTSGEPVRKNPWFLVAALVGLAIVLAWILS
jgi:hypothetical protein